MSQNKPTEPTVITFSELLVVLLLSLSLMLLFFPKNSIQQAIEAEKSNYDLTLIYLQSIAKAYPKDPHNWLRLLDAQLKMGHIQEAQKTFQKLQKFDNINQNTLAIMSYQLIKTRYQQSTDAVQKQRLFTLLNERLSAFIQSDDPTLWLTVLQQARTLHLHKLHFQALQKRIAYANFVDMDELRELFTLATQLGYEKKSIKILESILHKNPNMQIAQFLKSYYLSQSNYTAASQLCQILYQAFHKNKCFFEAVKYAFFAKKTDTALQLLKAHQQHFKNDPSAAQQIIKLYLANGYVKEAHAYSLQVMQKQGVLP